MITEIEKEFSIESAHRLPNVPKDHKCFRIHGHSFRIVVRVRGPVDGLLGWVIDFAAIGEAWKPLHEELDHRLLNDVPGLENPTSEALAKYIADRLVIPLPAKLHSVTIHETCTSACTVFP